MKGADPAPLRAPEAPVVTGVEVIHENAYVRFVARTVAGADEPFYLVEAPDYVTVVALTAARELLLVRQPRPALGQVTLELPSGHVDPGEEPPAAAARELLEETGFEPAGELLLTGNLAPDTGRLCNRLWCFLAAPVAPRTGSVPELQLVRMPLAELGAALRGSVIVHALNIAALGMAAVHRPDLFRAE